MRVAAAIFRWQNEQVIKSLRLLLASLLVLAVLFPLGAQAATPTDLLPDLVADPPANPLLDYYSYPGGGGDLLLRFDGYIHNVGAGPLEMNASRSSSSDALPPTQRIYRSDGSTRDVAMTKATLLYATADGHNHWHLQNAARYSLWDSDRSARVAPALKVGFCLGDVHRVESYGPSSPYYQPGSQFCQQNHPDALSLVEGISRGWQDVYVRSLALQWVVASDVEPGKYALREDVDPDGLLLESNESNAPGWSTSDVTIPGWVAQPVDGGEGAYGQARQLTLGASKFGSPGARRFRIVTPPAHGHLDVATGDAFTGPGVIYTPDDGYAGPDEFTYQARDSTSAYPLHPQVATVSLDVASAPKVPRVTIDSAPASVETSHSAQLSATVENDLPGVTWSVDGVDGGNGVAGTISPSGLYTAPSSVPAGGHVTIGARSASGAHDQRVVAIAPEPVPIPSPGTPPPTPRPHSLLSSIAVARQGRVLAMSVIPAKTGTIELKARAGSHHFGGCRARQPARRRFSCRVNLRPGQRLGKLKVVARLYRRGKVAASAFRVGAPQGSHRR